MTISDDYREAKRLLASEPPADRLAVPADTRTLMSLFEDLREGNPIEPFWSPRMDFLGMDIISSDYLPDGMVWKQVRFPRSKKKRIRKKWRKNPKNWGYVQGEPELFVVGNKVMGHPRVIERLHQRLESQFDYSELERRTLRQMQRHIDNQMGEMIYGAIVSPPSTYCGDIIS